MQIVEYIYKNIINLFKTKIIYMYIMYVITYKISFIQYIVREMPVESQKTYIHAFTFPYQKIGIFLYPDKELLFAVDLYYHHACNVQSKFSKKQMETLSNIAWGVFRAVTVALLHHTDIHYRFPYKWSLYNS